MSGLLVIISGPSGVGKDTIIDRLLSQNPEQFCYSISATTRAPRGNEVNGKDYFFINDMEFLTMINENKFLEWAEYNDNFYGTPLNYVKIMIAQDKVILTEIEVKGALEIMSKDIRKLSIFLMPPDKDELLNRLQKRSTDDEDSIKKRLEIAGWEMQQSHNFDEIVVNDEIDATVSKISQIIHNILNI